MGIVQSNMKPGSLRGRTARLAGLDRGDAGTLGTEGEGGYDPAEYNVDDVVAYAREHPDLAAAILELEKHGKGRKTVIEPLESMTAAS